MLILSRVPSMAQVGVLSVPADLNASYGEAPPDIKSQLHIVGMDGESRWVIPLRTWERWLSVFCQVLAEKYTYHLNKSGQYSYQQIG